MHVIAYDNNSKRENTFKCNRAIGVCALAFIAITMCALFTFSGVSQTTASMQRQLLSQQKSTMPTKGHVIKFKTTAEDTVQLTELRFGEVLGEGSFAIVYKGTMQVQQADKSGSVHSVDCAIKVSKSDDVASAGPRFQREAEFMRAVGEMLPENALKLHLVFAHDNRCYVLEELGGDSLFDVLYKTSGEMDVIRASLDVRRVTCDMLLQGGNALRTLNDAGLVHKDIKLANLLIGRGDGQIIKIIDLGMMQQLAAEADAKVTLTFGGSPSTMSSLMHWIKPDARISKEFQDKKKVEISAFVQQNPSVIDMPSLVMSALEFLVMTKASQPFDEIFNAQKNGVDHGERREFKSQQEKTAKNNPRTLR